MATMESKLDLILGKLISLEQDVGGLKQDVGGLKQDVGGLKQDVGGLKQYMDQRFEAQDRRFEAQERRLDEIVAAFKENWGDMAGLYRRVREDVKLFEERLEAKLSHVNQSIVALKDSIDRQDFRSDELGRRINVLEDRPPRF
jgi:predicted RNase H-like nuclease (RuvC/YqgF family)